MTWQPRAIAALMLAVLGLFTVAVWSGNSALEEYHQDLEYYNRKCNAERQSKEGDYKKDCQRILYRAVDDPVSVFTFVLTLATVGLFAATYFLWRATRDLVHGADKTAERQLRAYLLVEMAIPKSEGSNYIIGEVIIKNYGQTPATNVQITRGIDILPIGGVDESVNVKSMPQTIIGPDGREGAMAVIQIEPARYREIVKSHKDGTSVVLFGRVNYVDVFGEHRTTKFRYFTIMPTHGGYQFVACPEGNSYT